MEEVSSGGILGMIKDVLTYQIFSIDSQGFSLSTILTGIVLISIGVYVCRRGARMVDQRILSRLGMEDSSRYTMSRAIYYLFLITWVLFTLRLMSVPLTIFTVVGGALAVGIGFGSQNLVNNFISGIMVMMERPMKVGDYINIGSVSGTVERIGIRATSIRTTRNTLVVVPNKTFLEEFLTNFSNCQGSVKSYIRVGVAYGTSPQDVLNICSQAVLEDALCLPSHPPMVQLVDFADNCLLFETVSWLQTTDYREVSGFESRVRLRMNEYFLRANISIPFPQRDVRMEFTSPIQVMLSDRKV